MLLPSRRAVKEGAWVPGGGFQAGATDLARWAMQSGPMWAGPGGSEAGVRATWARIACTARGSVLDGGDDPQGPATAGTGEDIESEHGSLPIYIASIGGPG
jgi:hypothetical protein